jgi:hypothetical protein
MLETGPEFPAPGTLVRYRQTTTRWYFAVVRSAKPNVIGIELFWGEQAKVPPDQVQPFAEFMAERRKSLFMDRSQLCRCFFGEDLLRLREDRRKKMQSVLRKHGYSFSPEEWPSSNTRIYIQADQSVVSPGLGRVDRELAALLPQWLDPQKMPPSSRDPLGLQAHAERIANKLLPGLTVNTTRIGYYGFLCWAINSVNTRDPLPGTPHREMLNRLERALVLCEFVYHGSEDLACRVVGQRSRTQVLQNSENNRYQLPRRILKNQNVAGALRLYSTSLISMGFAEEAPELAIDGKLPWVLTDLGRSLNHAFARRVPEGFADFAFGDGAKLRESVRSWGSSLCLSKLRNLNSYRDLFLTGFLRGNSESAETRFSTVKRLFKRKLLDGTYEGTTQTQRRDAVGEDEVDLTEEVVESDGSTEEMNPEPEGLTNYEVLIHCYEENPAADNAGFQEAAVYEFMALGLSAVFHHVARRLQDSGQRRIGELQQELAKDRIYSKAWARPRREASRRARPLRQIIEDLFEAEGNPAHQAVVGGELLMALARDAPYDVVQSRLAESPVLPIFMEYFRSEAGRTLSETYPQLLAGLIERHGEVSANKNRQRWCYLDGDMVIRDDLQPMNLALHAVRFSQLYALCADVGLQRSDLTDVS